MSSKPEPHTTPYGNAAPSKHHKKKKRSRISTEDLTHPYILKFNAWEAKIMTSLNKLYDLADNDLVICDRRTGLNDFSINLKFADKLEDLAKALVSICSKCCQWATDIRNKISEAQDQKRIANQEIFFLGEVADTEKCDVVQGWKTLCSNHFKSDPDKLPPPPPPKRQHVSTIYISMDEEDEVQAGDIDTKFTYVKSNSNSKERYKCSECGKCFCDGQELRNHASNHALELYRCICCSHISRLERSYYTTCKHTVLQCIIVHIKIVASIFLWKHPWQITSRSILWIKCTVPCVKKSLLTDKVASSMSSTITEAHGQSPVLSVKNFFGFRLACGLIAPNIIHSSVKCTENFNLHFFLDYFVNTFCCLPGLRVLVHKLATKLQVET